MNKSIIFPILIVLFFQGCIYEKLNNTPIKNIKTINSISIDENIDMPEFPTYWFNDPLRLNYLMNPSQYKIFDKQYKEAFSNNKIISFIETTPKARLKEFLKISDVDLSKMIPYYFNRLIEKDKILEDKLVKNNSDYIFKIKVLEYGIYNNSDGGFSGGFYSYKLKLKLSFYDKYNKLIWSEFQTNRPMKYAVRGESYLGFTSKIRAKLRFKQYILFTLKLLLNKFHNIEEGLLQDLNYNRKKYYNNVFYEVYKIK